LRQSLRKMKQNKLKRPILKPKRPVLKKKRSNVRISLRRKSQAARLTTTWKLGTTPKLTLPTNWITVLVSDLVALQSSRWTPVAYQHVWLRTTDFLQLALLISAHLPNAVLITANLRAWWVPQPQAVLSAMRKTAPMHSIPPLASFAMHLRKKQRRKNKIKKTLTGQSREVQLNIARPQNSTVLLTNVDQKQTVQVIPWKESTASKPPLLVKALWRSMLQWQLLNHSERRLSSVSDGECRLEHKVTLKPKCTCHCGLTKINKRPMTGALWASTPTQRSRL